MIITVPVAPTVEVDPAEARSTDADTHHTPVALLLTQTDRVLKLPPAELAKEIARLGEAEDATPDTPLLLATALAQTRQAVDTARALGLVQRVLGNTSPAAQPLHPWPGCWRPDCCNNAGWRTSSTVRRSNCATPNAATISSANAWKPCAPSNAA